MAIVYGVIALIVNISPTHILHPGLSHCLIADAPERAFAVFRDFIGQ